MICPQCERLRLPKSRVDPLVWNTILWMSHVCVSCQARNTTVRPDEEQDLPIPVPSPELSGYKTRRGQFFAAQDALRELATGERIRRATRRRSGWHEEEEDDHDLFRM